MSFVSIDESCEQCRNPLQKGVHTCRKHEPKTFQPYTMQDFLQSYQTGQLSTVQREQPNQLLQGGRVRIDGKVYEWAPSVTAWLLVLDP